MTTPRRTASTITDDALDELYDNASRGWRRGDEWKERALAAETAIARITAWCDELDVYARTVMQDDIAAHPVAANLRAKLAEPKERNTP